MKKDTYEDIINLPHPVSKKALTGYEAAIDEATEKGAADISAQ